MEKLLTTAQAADLLSVKPDFVIRRTRASWMGIKIPFCRVGNRLRFKPSDIENYSNFFKDEPARQSKAGKDAEK
jgi:excisionase family DNA binding protein